MPPNSHAILSASSSHRWMNCTPSARLEREFTDREIEAAAEGTAAHALCEHKLRRALKMRSRKPVSKYDCDEMDGYTDGYVEFVLEQLTQAKLECADPLVLIEQRLDFSCWVPEGFGTGDCLIVARMSSSTALPPRSVTTHNSSPGMRPASLWASTPTGVFPAPK